MKNKFYLIVLLIGVILGFLSLNALAQEASMSEVYKVIFEDTADEQSKSDMINFFEGNFPQTIKEFQSSGLINQKDELIDFLGSEFEEYAEVMPMREDDPNQFQVWLQYKRKDYSGIVLGWQIKRLKLKKEPEKNKIAGLEKQLKNLLNELLEMRLTQESKEIKELEKELENLKRVHTLRKENQDSIIKNRFNELTGNKDIFEW
jgi:hypothetical protein